MYNDLNFPLSWSSSWLQQSTEFTTFVEVTMNPVFPPCCILLQSSSCPLGNKHALVFWWQHIHTKATSHHRVAFVSRVASSGTAALGIWRRVFGTHASTFQRHVQSHHQDSQWGNVEGIKCFLLFYANLVPTPFIPINNQQVSCRNVSDVQVKCYWFSDGNRSLHVSNSLSTEFSQSKI
jgi:hypothetical protein